MPKFIPYSIKRGGGITAHLNSHTELGYKLFRRARETGITVADIARLFAKNRLTIKHWIDMDDAENGVPVPQKGGKL